MLLEPLDFILFVIMKMFNYVFDTIDLFHSTFFDNFYLFMFVMPIAQIILFLHFETCHTMSI
jgi:hypothetical protein